MADRGEAGEQGVVGDELGASVVEVVQRGGGVAGVPDEGGVDEQLQADGVAAMVVFVGGKLGARADDELAAQRVQRLALVELAGEGYVSAALRGRPTFCVSA